MGNSKSGLEIEKHLLKDERVIWSASPVIKAFLKYLLSHEPMRFIGYYFFFLGLAFTIFGVSFLFLATPKPPPKEEAPGIIFALLGLPFVGIGYALSFGGRRRIVKQFEKTKYYLTNKRAIIITGSQGQTMLTVDMKSIPQVSLSLISESVGNIVFGESDPTMGKGFWRFLDLSYWWRGNKNKLNGFVAIENAEETMRRVSQHRDEVKT